MRHAKQPERERPGDFKLEVPHDVTNEQILVAAAIADPAACAQLVRQLPRADWFKEQAAAAAWGAILELSRRQLVVDLPAVQHAAAPNAKAAYLAELLAAFPTPPKNLAHHVEALRDDAARAEAVAGPIAALLDAIRDPTTKRDRLRALGLSVAKSLEFSGAGARTRDPAAVAREMREDLLDRRTFSNYRIGLTGLDGINGERPLLRLGSAPGFVTTVTGVTGNGKSTVAAMIALYQASQSRRVLYGAWEMGAKETVKLLALMSLALEQPGAGWSRSALYDGSLDDEQVQWLYERAEDLGSYIKFFDPPFQHETTRRYRNNEAIDECAGQIADSGCHIYVLDLWERMIPDAKPEDERRALFRQQQITQETATHGVLVAQQKAKEIEAGDDKRPTRGGILGSGAWIEISDQIIGTYRPALYKAVPDDLMELLVLKQRQGPWPRTVEADWDVESVRLTNGREVSTRTAERSEETEGMDKFLAGGGRRRPKR